MTHGGVKCSCFNTLIVYLGFLVAQWWRICPGSGRSPGEGNGYPLHYFETCLQWILFGWLCKRLRFLSDSAISFQLWYISTSCEELTHWKRPWCWEGLGAGGEGDDRGWDGWMASATRWAWVWVNSGSWWWTGRPGLLRVIHGVAKSQIRLNDWSELMIHVKFWLDAF